MPGRRERILHPRSPILLSKSRLCPARLPLLLVHRHQPRLPLLLVHPRHPRLPRRLHLLSSHPPSRVLSLLLHLHLNRSRVPLLRNLPRALLPGVAIVLLRSAEMLTRRSKWLSSRSTRQYVVSYSSFHKGFRFLFLSFVPHHVFSFFKWD